MKNSKIYRVGISGSYGGLNLGDEAILQSIIEQLRASVPVEITVFTRNVEDTGSRHKVDRVVPVRDLLRGEVLPEVERLDLLILGGGGILFDPEIRVFLREVELAHQKKIPVMLYAVGAGPMNSEETRKQLHRALADVSAITVREKSARRFLEEIGIHCGVTVTADPAFLLEPETLPDDILKKERIDASRPLVGMSVREPGPAAPDINPDFYHALLANAADYMIERFDADIIFIPMERQTKDMQHSHAVISQMLRPQRAWVLRGEYTSGQILYLTGLFEFAVGMRLHFLIFAAMQGIPFVALPYATKVAGLLEEFHIQIPPIRLVNAGRLLAYIDQSWDNRSALREKIKNILPDIQERSRKNNKIAVGLLTNRLQTRLACGEE